MHRRHLAAGAIAACLAGLALLPAQSTIGPASAASGIPGGSISAPTSGAGTESDPYIANVSTVVPDPQSATDVVRDKDGALNVVANKCGKKSADADSLMYTYLGYNAPTTLTWTPRYAGQADDGCTDGSYRAHLQSGLSTEPVTFEASAYVVQHYGVTPGTYLFSFVSKPDLTVTYRHRRGAVSKATKESVFFNKTGKVIYRGVGAKMPTAKRAKVKSWSTTVTFSDYQNKPVTWTRRLGKKMVTSTVKTNSAGTATFKFTKSLGTYTGFQAVTRQVSYEYRLTHPVALFTAPGEPNHYEAFQYPFGPMGS